MNLYEFNQNIINQLSPMSSKQIDEKKSLIQDFYVNHNNNHYMLLCSEYKYYTIFERDNNLPLATFGYTVCETIEELGDVLSIEQTKDGSAIEIWIRPEEENVCMVFYLFPYDKGVIYHG